MELRALATNLGYATAVSPPPPKPGTPTAVHRPVVHPRLIISAAPHRSRADKPNGGIVTAVR
jgi:hypothetical protein